MSALRVIFAGSPAAAVPSLEALAAGPHEIATVLTRTDAPVGRRRVPTPTPVAVAAERLGLPVVKADRLAAVTERLLALRVDLGVIVAYGGLVREPLLSGPRLGWINLHFSLLPRWRGAAPVQRAIMAGDEVTGSCVFQLVERLDAGPVFAWDTVPIGSETTAGELLGELAESGARQLVAVVDGIAAGTARAVEQTGEPTHAAKPTADDARIVWAEPADRVSARIRGTTPEPGAFTVVDGADRLKVLAVAAVEGDSTPSARPGPGEVMAEGGRVLVGTADAPLELRLVHPAGGRAMSADAWWRGRARDRATVLG